MGDSRCQYELFVREDVPAHAVRRQQVIEERLRGLADDVRVESWPKRVRRWSDGGVLARYDEFAAWADDADVSLSPYFSSRGVYSFEDGRQFDALVLPVCTLAVSDDDGLRAVYPHSDDGTPNSVSDALDAIEPPEATDTGADAELAD